MFEEGFIDKYYYRYHRAENHKACIFAIHGLGGHCIWFDKSAKLFNEQAISMFSFDLPAFGQSEFPRGDLKSYEEWVSASRKMFNELFSKYLLNVPVFILGHSMGAMIALHLSEVIKPKGFILSVPGFEGHPDSFSAKLIFSILTKALIRPKGKVMLPFGPEILVKNTDTQMLMKKDEFRVISPSAKLLLEVKLLTNKAKKIAAQFNDSVFLLQASDDMVCSNEAMEKAFITMKSEDKTRKVYKGLYHDIFLEDELEDIIDDIATWTLARS